MNEYRSRLQITIRYADAVLLQQMQEVVDRFVLGERVQYETAINMATDETEFVLFDLTRRKADDLATKLIDLANQWAPDDSESNSVYQRPEVAYRYRSRKPEPKDAMPWPVRTIMAMMPKNAVFKAAVIVLLGIPAANDVLILNDSIFQTQRSIVDTQSDMSSGKGSRDYQLDESRSDLNLSAKQIQAIADKMASEE